MAIKRIFQGLVTGGNESENNLLHTKALYVTEINDKTTQVISDLRDTLWAYPFCVGLSAPQIGEPYAISVINCTHQKPEDDIILINPEILSTSGKKDRKRESCMSVWGLFGEVERREKIVIRYQDLNFKVKEEKYEGFIARIIQHEVDHLNGILYSEKLVQNNSLSQADFFANYRIID